jgi:uncharacterized cupredoxin-like copper-binding protein
VAHPPSSSRPARRTAAAALALGLGLLSACSDDGGDTGAADASTSSSAAETSAAETSAAETSSAPATTTSAAPAPAETQAITATEGEMFIEFSEDSFTPGTYTIQVNNTGNMPHDLILEQNGQDVTGTEVIQPGQSATLEVTLEAGDYVFYCSVGAHRAAGMELPVTVAA